MAGAVALCLPTLRLAQVSLIARPLPRIVLVCVLVPCLSSTAQPDLRLHSVCVSAKIASACKQTCVLTVCQQQHWQVFEHRSNSRIKARVGKKSVPTLDIKVQTFELTPGSAPHSGCYM